MMTLQELKDEADQLVHSISDGESVMSRSDGRRLALLLSSLIEALSKLQVKVEVRSKLEKWDA